MRERPVTLVTGALGFVARWLIDDLLAGGESVVGFDLAPAAGGPPARLGAFACEGPDAAYESAFRYRSRAGSWVFVPCDLSHPAAVSQLISRIEPATVYHLAAQSSAGVSFRDPAGTFAANVSGTLNLLEAVRALPPNLRPALLAAGSCEEYGAQGRRRVPLHERSVLNPVSPYGVSKVAQSLLCLQYHRSFGLPIIVTRAFSHTGPGHDTRFAFPSFAHQIAAAERGSAEPVLTVGNLDPLRDYLDVRDVIRAYRLLIDKGEPGQVYNVCSGQALTIRQGLEILLQAARRRIEVQPDPKRVRPSDIPMMVGDGTKLRQRTGWQAEHRIQDTLLELLASAREECS